MSLNFWRQSMSAWPSADALAGRVALVTGGARRLGGYVSRGLARAGADVAVHYATSASDAAAVVADIEALGRHAAAFQADLAHVDQAQMLVRAALAEFGRLDILVHAASPFHAARFDRVTEAVWDDSVDVTLKAAFFTTQAAAPALAEARGSIVFITDIAARAPYPGFIPHSAAKAGLENLILSLAQALAPAVRVNSVAPGIVLPPDAMSAAQTERLAQRTLVGRVGSPDDVVQAVLFLVLSPFITGHSLVVDGGEMARRFGSGAVL